MNWATGVPARSTVPGKSTRRHHISVDVPAPASTAVPRSPGSLATGLQRRIVQRHSKPSGVSNLRFSFASSAFRSPTGWNLSACVTVRHEATFRQRAQLSPQSVAGGARRAKGTHSSTPPSMQPTKLLKQQCHTVWRQEEPQLHSFDRKGGLQPSICNKATLHLQIPCGHKQTCSKMHTDATGKGQRVTRECVWLRADLDATGPIQRVHCWMPHLSEH